MYVYIYSNLIFWLTLHKVTSSPMFPDTWLDVDALATALRFLGVLVVGGARVGVGVVSVEVTPTTARASAVGLSAAHAAMGEILAPLLALVVGGDVVPRFMQV